MKLKKNSDFINYSKKIFQILKDEIKKHQFKNSPKENSTKNKK
jgi:hypothetical protein